MRVPVVVEGVERDFGRREQAQAKRTVKRLGDMPSKIASTEIWRRCKAKATEIRLRTRVID